MTSIEIAQYVCHGFDEFIKSRPSDIKWNALRDELLKFISTHETAICFYGLLWVLENQNGAQYQWLAGELLDRASIPCLMPLHDFLCRVLKNYNISVETVPNYLVKTFGKNFVLEELQKMKEMESDRDILIGIEGIGYQLGKREKN